MAFIDVAPRKQHSGTQCCHPAPRVKWLYLTFHALLDDLVDFQIDTGTVLVFPVDLGLEQWAEMTGENQGLLLILGPRYLSTAF